MVDRFNPPAVNDEAEKPEFVEMSQSLTGKFVSYQDYDQLQQEIVLLRANARRMMAAVKNACLEVVEEKKDDTMEAFTVLVLQDVEDQIREIGVDYEIFKPKD